MTAFNGDFTQLIFGEVVAKGMSISKPGRRISSRQFLDIKNCFAAVDILQKSLC